jgi:hypothetical protein
MKNDPRRYQWYRQRKKWGFDDRETWSLDNSIAKFVLPRLKRFREITYGYPSNLTLEKWQKILDKMIYAMDMVCKEWDGNFVPEDDHKKVAEGLKLFGQYFRHLWW